MGLTKQYLKYSDVGVFGVVASSLCNVVQLDEDRTIVAACELVYLWNTKTQEKIKTFYGEKVSACRISVSHDLSKLAVGYMNGVIHIFDVINSIDPEITFKGHTSAVSVLNFNTQGMQLVSASKDTNIIMWDIVNECGLFRLKGHKSEVTQVCFIPERDTLVSCSKDTFVKFWDLKSQHCFKTLVDHRTEVWDLLIIKEVLLDSCYLITGCSDNLLRIFNLKFNDQDNDVNKDIIIDSDENSDDEIEYITSSPVGYLRRSGKGRTVSLHSLGTTFACMGTDAIVEVFSLKTVQENVQNDDNDSENNDISTITDTLKTITFTGKLSNFNLYKDSKQNLKIVGLLSNNKLQYIEYENPEQIDTLSKAGHGGEVRCLAFSSDNTAIVSGGSDSIKVWNRATTQCIRTVACQYTLCCTFAPGDRHIITGSKSGKVQIFDVASSSLLETIDAHSGPIWSLSLSPNKKEIVTGSEDHTIKFWLFELIKDDNYSTIRKRLSLSNSRTLKMSDDVLFVKYSPDQKFIAASLLDSTIKVFYADSLKFFLSLYGHKLPVLSFDISTDGTILASASSDRNIRLWGLDFGDCHKSIFAHDESILCLQFIPKTHMFFSCSRDHKIKQWDADNYENIITLKGHQNIVWSLAISPSGNFMVSSSQDHSLRLWEKTSEPIVLHDQREVEREEEYENSAVDQPVIVGETSKETAIAGIQTVTTVRSAERLMEALLIEETDGHLYRGQKTPEVVHPMLNAYQVKTPSQYVLAVLREIRSSELEEALLVLPYAQVVQLIILSRKFLKHRLQTELIVRTVVFLLKIHEGKLTSSQDLCDCLTSICNYKRLALQDNRDTIGFNIAGLNRIKQFIDDNQSQMDSFKDTQKVEYKSKTIIT